jgi:UDP:flavonoid glycosyltransferase YjiC (YdhE family)
MPEQFREHMAETFDRFGITDLPQRYTAIDVAPPSMLDRPVHGWSVRYVPYNGGGILPSWMSAPIAWPRVAVTLGTLAPETLGIDPIRRIIHIAEGHDAEFVLALGDTDLAELGPLPSNVRSAGWVPLNALLRSCAAVVHHGGAGSTLTSLVAGVPQLVLPTGADRHINAAAVTRRNAGLEAEPDDLSAELLTTLLRDSSLAAAAREVSAEIAALPSPAALVETLVDYVRTASGNEGGPSGTPAELAGGDRGGSGGTG